LATIPRAGRATTLSGQPRKLIGQILAGEDLFSDTLSLHREQLRTPSRPKNGRVRCIMSGQHEASVSGASPRVSAVSSSMSRFFKYFASRVRFRQRFVSTYAWSGQNPI
jgi:hypothetical protein